MWESYSFPPTRCFFLSICITYNLKELNTFMDAFCYKKKKKIRQLVSFLLLPILISFIQTTTTLSCVFILAWMYIHVCNSFRHFHSFLLLPVNIFYDFSSFTCSHFFQFQSFYFLSLVFFFVPCCLLSDLIWCHVTYVNMYTWWYMTMDEAFFFAQEQIYVKHSTVSRGWFLFKLCTLK